MSILKFLFEKLIYDLGSSFKQSMKDESEINLIKKDCENFTIEQLKAMYPKVNTLKQEAIKRIIKERTEK